MALQYSPKIVQDGLLMCLDASQNKSYPTDLPVKNGLVMWMDASDDTTFSYSTGTTVTQWRDKSGSDYHMVPKSSGPTRSSFLNSRKVLAFTASQTIGNNTINLASSANTVFLVSRLTGVTSGRVLTCNLDASGNNWLLGQHGGTANDYYAEGWVYDAPSAVNLTSWKVFMGDWSGTATDLANFYTDGTALTTNSSAASQGPNKLGINYYSNETSTCEVAEIIVFNRVLSSTERKQVHTYLGQKWGILNTDRSIIDLSGYDDNGLLGNGSTSNMPVYNYYNKGGLRFNSSLSNYVVSPNTTISGSQTFCVWAVMTGKQNSPTGVLSQHDYASTANFGINILTSNQLAPSIGYTNGTREFQSKTTTGVISYNQIFNVVLVYNAGLNKIYWYINGVFDSEYTLSLTPKSTNWPIGLGRWDPSYNDYYFDGTIFSALIYNKALSATEIAQNYEAQKGKFANTIVQQGLVLNLDSGNPYSYAGAGSTWYDASGNSFNATLINSPTYTSDNNGVLNWASVNAQYATVSMNSTLRVANITQEAWIYLSTTADQVFIGSQYGTGSNNSFALWIESGVFKFGVNTSGTFYSSSSSSVSSSTWYHITHTYNGTTQLFYINGALVSTYNSSASGNITYDLSNTLLAIGADFNGVGYNVGPLLYVNGKMPVVRIYNRALSAAEVLQNYNSIKGRFGL